MPNEPAESNFKSKIHATAYPCTETAAGMIWTYMECAQTCRQCRAWSHSSSPEGEYRVPLLAFQHYEFRPGARGRPRHQPRRVSPFPL